MLIREFQEKDRQIYYQMSENFYDSDAVLHKSPITVREALFNDIMAKSPYIRGIIIEEENKAVGFALLAHSYSTELGRRLVWLEELYISDLVRGKGLGSRFLAWLFEDYKGTKCAFRLEVSPENSRVMELYKRFDFENLDYLQMVKTEKI